MNSNYKKKKNKLLVDEEVEKIFETTWNNLTSRRACEQTHLPNYIKKQIEKNKDSND